MSQLTRKKSKSVSIHVAKGPQMFDDLVVLKGPYTAFLVLAKVFNVHPTATVRGNPRFRDPFDGRIASVAWSLEFLSFDW